MGNQLHLRQQSAETSSMMGAADSSQSNSARGIGNSSDRSQYPRASSSPTFRWSNNSNNSNNPHGYQTPTTESIPSTSKLMGNSIGQNRQATPLKAGEDSPAVEGNLSPQTRVVNRRPRHREAGSTMSLSDDHFDQYTVKAAGISGQPEVNDGVNMNPMLPNDWNNKTQRGGSDNAASGDRGSLPNLDDLATQSVYLKREEASRLASQRRQEAQRLLEEEQLLKANPLRYLYHPLFRTWLVRWKVPLLLILGNILLLYYLVHLLTNERDTGEKTDSS
uniref:Uncharacterized protein n=1 Tax=Ditylenchus dipsaci TaxID=166011 RepID=A0A915E9U3_9BILA